MIVTTPRVRFRPIIEALSPYRQGKQANPNAFKLSSNENPYPPLPAVRAALAESRVNRYPDASAAELSARLADRFGVAAANIQVGAGSVSVIMQLITAVAEAGDEIVYAWRSFEAYPGLIAVAGATGVPVPLMDDHRHDLAAMARAITERTRMVIVCSPNNPTGTTVSGAEFAQFMTQVPETVLVLLDEAYAEFVTDSDAVSGSPLLQRYPNLVLARTFSKAYGLAGLRIGYAVGPDYVMDAARATAIPLSVTEPAQRAALISLDHEAELLDRVTAIAALRDEVWAALVDQGWSVPRPQGNFVWLPTGDDTKEATEVLAEHGIVARALGEGIRVSIGEHEAVGGLLAATARLVRSRRSAPARATLD